MKRTIILLSGLLLLSMLVLPASAEQSIFQASGTLDEYDGPPQARVVSGSWTIKVNAENEVTFMAQYLEENIAEEIPGTFDKFTIYVLDISSVVIADSTCTFTGQLTMKKIGWDNEDPDYGYIGDPPGPRHFREFTLDVVVTITSSDITIVILGSPWTILGTTLRTRV